MPSPKLHSGRYEDLILRRGRTVKWQEAINCSCSNNGHPNYECAACKGMGNILTEAVTDRVLLVSVTHNQEFQEMAGIFEVGDAIMSVGAYVPETNPDTGLINKVSKGRPNPIFQVGDGDVITLTDDAYKTSEVLTKGVPLFAREADTLINEDVVEVRRVQSVDVVTGDITVYSKDTDFTVEGNKIVWQGVNVPADGENYTVVYTHRPSFVVFTTLPTPRHQDGQDLPRKVALRYRAGGVDRR